MVRSLGPVVAAAAVLAAVLLPPAGANAATLEDVKARGELLCGVNQGLLGFAAQDAAGAWSGFDVDFCRAVAAAIFGDGGKVRRSAIRFSISGAFIEPGSWSVMDRDANARPRSRFPIRNRSFSPSCPVRTPGGAHLGVSTAISDPESKSG